MLVWHIRYATTVRRRWTGTLLIVGNRFVATVLVASTVFSSEPDGYRGKIEQFSLCTAERELLGGVDERRTVRSLRDSQVLCYRAVSL